MFGLNWSQALIVLIFIVFFVLYKQNRTIFIPLGPSLWPYSNLIVSHASPMKFLLTTSNLMFYFLYSIDITFLCL